MSRDDIIRMAREAGFQEPNPHDGYMGLAFDYRSGTDTGASLVRFAALVAAHEREQCAKAAEGFPQNRDWVPGSLWGTLCREVAAAIRARGQT